MRGAAALLSGFLFFILAASLYLFQNPVPQNPDFAVISPGDLIAIDLKYAGSDNFMGQNLYGDFNQCILHVEAAKKLKAAAANLKKGRRGWKLYLFDCLRPLHVQKQMWEKVKGSDKQSYVANPERGSIHNFGFAVDLTLLDDKGREVDMGTPFDSFSKLSEPRREEEFLQQGKLSAAQIENRKVLRAAMTEAGFTQLPNEWWHFDAKPPAEVRANYQIPNLFP